jgi:hypothetical protein
MPSRMYVGGHGREQQWPAVMTGAAQKAMMKPR